MSPASRPTAELAAFAAGRLPPSYHAAAPPRFTAAARPACQPAAVIRAALMLKSAFARSSACNGRCIDIALPEANFDGIRAFAAGSGRPATGESA